MTGFKKNIFIFILFLIVTAVFLSPQSKIEELQKKLKHVKGKEKADVLLEIAKSYWGTSPEKVFDYANQALELANKNNFQKEKADAYISIAYSHSNKGEFNKSIEFSLKALEIYETLRDSDGILTSLMELGFCNRELGLLENSGLVQEDMSRYEKALAYYQRAFPILEKSGTKRDLALFWVNLAGVYGLLEEYESALEYLYKALDYSEKPEDKGQCFSQIGFIHYQEENHEKALEFFLKGHNIWKNTMRESEKIISLLQIGTTYLALEDYERAFQYFEEGLVLAKQMDSKADLIAFYMNLSILFEEKKDYEKALDYYELYYDTKDEIINEKKNKEIEDLQIKYESAKKEMALKRQQHINVLLWAGFGFVIILTGVLYNQFRIKVKENKEKNKLFSIIAHDLGSPLNSLVFCSEHLKENLISLKEEDLKEVVEELSENAVRVSDSLKNLLKWVVSQLKKIKYNPQEIDLRAITNKITKLYQTAAKQKNIQLKSEVKPNTIIFADQNMIETVFGNIISNGIKFTNPGGKINISAKNILNKVQVEIKDNGIGINKNRLDKIFKMDVAKIRKGTAQEKGMGLGLMISKEFMEKNKGKIWVESEEHKGSQFYLEIPAGN